MCGILTVPLTTELIIEACGPLGLEAADVFLSPTTFYPHAAKPNQSNKTAITTNETESEKLVMPATGG